MAQGSKKELSHPPKEPTSHSKQVKPNFQQRKTVISHSPATAGIHLKCYLVLSQPLLPADDDF